MPIYAYTAKDGPTKVVTGEIEAVSQVEAVTKLEKAKLVPIKIEEKFLTGAARQPDAVKETGTERPSQVAIAPLNSIKVKAKDLDIFTRQLASLMKAGVPMLQSLALLVQQTEGKAMKAVVGDLAGKIKDGKTLSESMREYPRAFNSMYLSMIKAGEKSGTLDQALFRLAEHREREQEMRQKVQAAMAYPALVIVVGAGTIFVMLTYFLPKLTVIFKGMKQQLPLPTKILMGLTGFMSSYWYIFLIVLFAVIVIFVRTKEGSKKKAFFDAIKLKIPFVKKFTQDAQIARFARSLAILIKNGLPVHESLDLAADTLDNAALKSSVNQASRSIIEEGLSMSESFTRTKIFPDFTLNMITVGEQSGRMVEALEDIADVYEREVDQSIKIMTSLLEPILILVVGAVVGFIVFAMLLPVFNIGVMAR